jgi:hypothetical protein
VPNDVVRFIAAEIESVGQLEVLLLLRGAPDKQWTPQEVARALVSQVESVGDWLDRMAGSGLLLAVDGTYRYAPATAEVERTVDALAESFAKYRVAVIGLIFSKPSEGVRSFSDAFNLRRPKH